MIHLLGAITGLYKKNPNFEKSFFLDSYISEVRQPIFTKLISHLGNGSISGQKNFFSKISIFGKVTGPRKKFLPKILSNPNFAPPPLKKGRNFWIFPKLSKFTQKLVLGVFESEIFDFEH